MEFEPEPKYQDNYQSDRHCIESRLRHVDSEKCHFLHDHKNHKIQN
jgi:hypothetical protein